MRTPPLLLSVASPSKLMLAACMTAVTFGSFADARTLTEGVPVGRVPTTLPAAAPATAVPFSVEARTTAVPQTPHTVSIMVDQHELQISTTAPTVSAALAAAAVSVGRNDVVTPNRDAIIPADGRIRVQRVLSWTQRICARLFPRTLTQSSTHFAPGSTHILSAGHAGLEQTTIQFRSIDGRPVRPEVLAVRTLVTPQPRVVARGIAAPSLTQLADNAVMRTGNLAHSALAMIATAYTAYCAGCSGTGRGATGMRVTHGVVAVDPSIIPLGSHLFIPGYGKAVAGDTGGAIIGRRIDLAFDSYGEAINFGRRPVQVYVLKDSAH